MLVRILLIAALLWPGFAPAAAASVAGVPVRAGAPYTCCPLCAMSATDACGCGCSVEQAPAEPIGLTELQLAPDTPRVRLFESSARPVTDPALRVRAWVASGALDAQSARAAESCAWFCCWQT